jgi:hypothetical protein
MKRLRVSEVLLFDQRGFVDSHCYNQELGGSGSGSVQFHLPDKLEGHPKQVRHIQE